MKEIKFENLEFKPRTSQGMWDYKKYTCLQALVDFENGYSLSVLTADDTGSHKYCQASKDSYEIAILKDGDIYYNYSDKDRVGDGIDEQDLDQNAFEGVWVFQPKTKVEELLKIVSNFKKD